MRNRSTNQFRFPAGSALESCRASCPPCSGLTRQSTLLSKQAAFGTELTKAGSQQVTAAQELAALPRAALLSHFPLHFANIPPNT